MAILYSHRQFGRAMFLIAIVVALLAGGLATFFAVTSRAPSGPGFWLSMIVSGFVVLALLIGFSSLRVTVTDDRVSWHFGPGLMNFSARVRDIERVETVRPSLIYGIGIRITPKGWLYNVGAGNAVAITTGKKTVLVGTDDPVGLMRAIEAARSQSNGAA